MNDLVKALREEAEHGLFLYGSMAAKLLIQAANEIERLQNQSPHGEDLANIMTGDE
jgi:hypothetical protein